MACAFYPRESTITQEERARVGRSRGGGGGLHQILQSHLNHLQIHFEVCWDAMEYQRPRPQDLVATPDGTPALRGNEAARLK